MKGLLIVLFLGGAGYGVYKITAKPSAPYAAFLKFDQAKSKGDCATLMAVTEGQALEWVNQYCGGRFSAASLASQMSGSPSSAMLGVKFKKESETKAADGSVTLKVRGSVTGRPSQVRGPWRDTVTLKEAGGVWKLSAYSTEDIK